MENEVKEYKSENPLVQKCLDALDRPGIRLKAVGGYVNSVFLGDVRLFGMSDSGPLFINNDTFYNIDTRDISMLLAKYKIVLKKQELEKLPAALEWLNQTPKTEPVEPVLKPTFVQKIKEMIQRVRS